MATLPRPLPPLFPEIIHSYQQFVHRRKAALNWDSGILSKLSTADKGPVNAPDFMLTVCQG